MRTFRDQIRARLRWVPFVAGYTLASYLLLRPILQTYVVADDFSAPFYQLDVGANSLFRAAAFGWDTSFVGGDRTRTVGGVLGAVTSWLWLWCSKTFDVSILDVFAVLRFTCFMACAMAVATFWWASARTYARPIRWRTALALVSVALFGTLQLHGLWANDPVQGYPLSGYGATAIGFGLLALTTWTGRHPSAVRFGVTTVVALLSVSYYEFNLGAVLGGTVILVAAAWARGGALRRRWTEVAGIVMYLIVPVAWMLLSGATHSGYNYSGRALHAAGAIHSLFIGLVSSLPGAAWSLSASVLAGNDGVIASAVAVAAAAVLATVAWLHWGSPSPAPSADFNSTSSSLNVVATASAAAVYAVFAIALEASTLKVQQEVTKIGSVYTSYAVGSAGVALLLAAVAWMIARRPGARWGWLKVALAAAGVVVIAMQLSYNLHLKALNNTGIAENQTLDSAFADGVRTATRCEALRNWMSYPWPDSYRGTVMSGTEVGYQTLYGQLMCPTFVAPADGFGPENGTLSDPQWWLTAPNGTIELRASDCRRGCRGTLYLTAGSFAIARRLTLSTTSHWKAQISVPGLWRRYKLPIRLTQTMTYIEVDASGPGIAPATVHAGSGTAPLWVDFTAMRFHRTAADTSRAR